MKYFSKKSLQTGLFLTIAGFVLTACGGSKNEPPMLGMWVHTLGTDAGVVDIKQSGEGIILKYYDLDRRGSSVDTLELPGRYENGVLDLQGRFTLVYDADADTFKFNGDNKYERDPAAEGLDFLNEIALECKNLNEELKSSLPPKPPAFPMKEYNAWMSKRTALTKDIRSRARKSCDI